MHFAPNGNNPLEADDGLYDVQRGSQRLLDGASTGAALLQPAQLPHPNERNFLFNGAEGRLPLPSAVRTGRGSEAAVELDFTTLKANCNNTNRSRSPSSDKSESSSRSSSASSWKRHNPYVNKKATVSGEENSPSSGPSGQKDGALQLLSEQLRKSLHSADDDHNIAVTGLPPFGSPPIASQHLHFQFDPLHVTGDSDEDEDDTFGRKGSHSSSSSTFDKASGLVAPLVEARAPPLQWGYSMEEGGVEGKRTARTDDLFFTAPAGATLTSPPNAATVASFAPLSVAVPSRNSTESSSAQQLSHAFMVEHGAFLPPHQHRASQDLGLHDVAAGQKYEPPPLLGFAAPPLLATASQQHHVVVAHPPPPSSSQSFAPNGGAPQSQDGKPSLEGLMSFLSDTIFRITGKVPSLSASLSLSGGQGLPSFDHSNDQSLLVASVSSGRGAGEEQHFTEDIACPAGWTLSVYDADISQHYTIESHHVMVTLGALKYSDFYQKYGSQTRFRFQLCKRYVNGRCSNGIDCQYIHSKVIPKSTHVHINENCASSASAALTAEVIEGGNNSLLYDTLPAGVSLCVYPPNNANAHPQMIPSQKILRTLGASNVYQVVLNAHHQRQAKIEEALRTTGKSPNLPPVKQPHGLKPRHCAHFQFKRMCNLGAECNFIHSLVPFIQSMANPSERRVESLPPPPPPPPPPPHVMMQQQQPRQQLPANYSIAYPSAQVSQQQRSHPMMVMQHQQHQPVQQQQQQQYVTYPPALPRHQQQQHSYYAPVAPQPITAVPQEYSHVQYTVSQHPSFQQGPPQQQQQPQQYAHPQQLMAPQPAGSSTTSYPALQSHIPHSQQQLQQQQQQQQQYFSAPSSFHVTQSNAPQQSMNATPYQHAPQPLYSQQWVPNNSAAHQTQQLQRPQAPPQPSFEPHHAQMYTTSNTYQTPQQQAYYPQFQQN